MSQLLLFNSVIRFNVFNSLVKYNPTIEHLPDLAESWENSDDKACVFKLRSGVTYHNGRTIEAGKDRSPFDRIAGNESIFSSRVANVASSEVVDPPTIKLKLPGVVRYPGGRTRHFATKYYPHSRCRLYTMLCSTRAR